jgi:hypothetical protein
MATETAPFWQFMVPETNENLFGKLWLGSRSSHILAIYGPWKLDHSVHFWFRILGPEIETWFSFWDQKLPVYGYFWIFS